MGFTQYHSGPLGDIKNFVQLIPGSYKSDKPINITVIDKIHLKAGCFDGTIINGILKPILYSFAFDQPPGHELYKGPQIKFFKKINKPLLSLIKFYTEDDDFKPVDFNNETKSFTCQLIKK